MISAINPHPGSFRDPAGTIFSVDGRIVRGLTEEGAARYMAVKDTGILETLHSERKIVSSTDSQLAIDSRFVHYLEHEPLAFISYPYEWPFLLLKDAALLHLKIQIDALDRNIKLIDASAYNVQFKGVNPIFIDILSFTPYNEGDYWSAHRQFCEHFLNPLLLYTVTGTPYQEWYRGSMEGIPTHLLAKLLPMKSWLSLKHLLHVLLPAASQKKKTTTLNKVQTRSQQKGLPKAVYAQMLRQLYNWIDKLSPKNHPTTWGDYTTTRLYESSELTAKKNFIKEFVSQTRPKQLWDIGCNDGEFAELALQNGAEFVVGFDLDLLALDNAVLRAKKHQLNFLPLYQQLTNPTPSQGWLNAERSAMHNRGNPDAITALAVIHHLALGNNVPLDQVVKWLVDLAPAGVIEYVQKSDPTVQTMLALKGDIFPHYTQENFVAILKQHASIVRHEQVSNAGRTLYWFDKR